MLLRIQRGTISGPNIQEKVFNLQIVFIYLQPQDNTKYVGLKYNNLNNYQGAYNTGTYLLKTKTPKQKQKH